MNAWMLSVTSLVGSGTATAQDAAETRNSSTPGSRLWLLRIHPPHSGERFGGEVRLFCTLLSTPRPAKPRRKPALANNRAPAQPLSGLWRPRLFVEEFFEDFAAGRSDPDRARDV